jgi:RNA polymerase sigma-70 factor (ECF subfamily)
LGVDGAPVGSTMSPWGAAWRRDSPTSGPTLGALPSRADTPGTAACSRIRVLDNGAMDPDGPPPSPEPDATTTSPGEWMSLVYDELRSLATRLFGTGVSKVTLQPTALVHEAFVRLATAERLEVRDRDHFFNVAAKAMRQILVDHLRARRAAKRGGLRARVLLDDGLLSLPGEAPRPVEYIDLIDALHELTELSERQGTVVTARIFGGMTVEEVARGLGVSRATVESDWVMARSWLRRRLGARDGSQPR